jgi:threonyl-tRNA synthetase
MEKLEKIRHSLAHILAHAVQNLYPDVQFGIGPAIENGFYYDFDLKHKFSPADLPKIENEMRRLIKQNLEFQRELWSYQKARQFFKNQPYKLELIKEKTKSRKVQVYKSGDFIDFCKGGHLKNAKKIDPRAFKLTRVAGAYWKGDEKNPQLQRIYGLAFETKTGLEEYLKRQKQAQEQDHRKLGADLGLFMFHETAPGIPYFLPKGLIILNELIDFWRQEHKKRGYQEISTPLINKKELWEKSGHWEHFREDMFIAKMGKNETYGLKPMNCPNAMIVFGARKRSYRELPLRLSDTDVLHRYERPGTLGGLMRVRAFRQDDSHNFITEDQIESEYQAIFEIADYFYKIFGLKYQLRLGTRPKKYLGDKKTWDRAESSLHKVLKKLTKGNYQILEGDGAFYGPKVDMLMKDALGRDWQIGTVQLDFQLPLRFGLKYIDKNGQEKTPAVIHRVIYGALERFIGILIEHFAGAFPVWLQPVQAIILPITEKETSYAQKLLAQANKQLPELRIELDSSNETLNKKIRTAELKKIPYTLVVGPNEAKNRTLNLRLRSKKTIGEISPEKFLETAGQIIKSKSLELWPS